MPTDSSTRRSSRRRRSSCCVAGVRVPGAGAPASPVRYKEKGPPKRAFHAVSCPSPLGHALLDLAFLVDHVLAHHGIVLLHFHLVRRVLLVLVGRVEVAGAGGGDQ